MPIVQRSLLIDDVIWRQAKAAAAAEGISVSEFCSRAILKAQPHVPGEPLVLKAQYAIGGPDLDGRAEFDAEVGRFLKESISLTVDPAVPDGMAVVGDGLSEPVVIQGITAAEELDILLAQRREMTDAEVDDLLANPGELLKSPVDSDHIMLGDDGFVHEVPARHRPLTIHELPARLNEKGETVVPWYIDTGMTEEPVPSPFTNVIKNPQDALNAVAEARRRKHQR